MLQFLCKMRCIAIQILCQFIMLYDETLFLADVVLKNIMIYFDIKSKHY